MSTIQQGFARQSHARAADHPQPRWRTAITATWPLFLCLAFLALYSATLAPTVLWGDDAYFQRTAFEGSLRADGGGHWLWLQVARLFLHLPWGDVAYRANLLSAVAAAGTLLFLYGAGRAGGLGTGGATAAVASLGVSHTFWSHAVRAEVYTLFTLLLALQIWLWFLWRPQRFAPLLAAAATCGVMLLGHQMALLAFPALAVLIWQRRHWLQLSQWILLGVAFGAGLLPFVLVLQYQIGWTAGVDFLESLRLYFTSAGNDFSGQILDFSLHSLPRDTALWLGFLGLQFVPLAGPLGLWGGVAAWRAGWPTGWPALAVLYATAVFFAFSYHVNDQFVFYLPSYLPFALFAGYGWQAAGLRLPVRWRRSLRVASLLLLAAGPVLTYAALVSALQVTGANPMQIRELPGREPNRFFLWPAKNGHWGAAHYGQAVLAALPASSILIADHTPLETLRYFQMVDGLRPDVTLVKIEAGQDLAPIVADLPADAPVFLADRDPRYYNLARLPGVELQTAGYVYRLSGGEP